MIVKINSNNLTKHVVPNISVEQSKTLNSLNKLSKAKAMAEPSKAKANASKNSSKAAKVDTTFERPTKVINPDNFSELAASPTNSNKPTASQSDSKKPVGSLYNFFSKTTASLSHSNEATASLYNSNKAAAYLSNSNKPTASLSNSNKPAASLSNSNKPTASLSNSNKPAASLSHSNKPTASLSNSNKPTASLSNSNKPTASLYNFFTKAPISPSNSNKPAESPTSANKPTKLVALSSCNKTAKVNTPVNFNKSPANSTKPAKSIASTYFKQLYKGVAPTNSIDSKPPSSVTSLPSSKSSASVNFPTNPKPPPSVASSSNSKPLPSVTTSSFNPKTPSSITSPTKNRPLRPTQQNGPLKENKRATKNQENLPRQLKKKLAKKNLENPPKQPKKKLVKKNLENPPKPASIFKIGLSRDLYALYNRECFDDCLPKDMMIDWNIRLRRTGGRCYPRRFKDRLGVEQRSARIELSTKVIDSCSRLAEALLHEMCHAAAWIAAGEREGHGPVWRSAADKAKVRFPTLAVMDKCHSYAIRTKFTYRCEGCGYSVGRHSKSVDTNRQVCGHCRRKFQLVVNYKGKVGEGAAWRCDSSREEGGDCVVCQGKIRGG